MFFSRGASFLSGGISFDGSFSKKLWGGDGLPPMHPPPDHGGSDIKACNRFGKPEKYLGMIQKKDKKLPEIQVLTKYFTP